MIKCDICGEDFKKQGGLTTHRKWHDIPENQSEQERIRKKLGHKGVNHPLYGIGHSEETKKKMSEARKGKSKPNSGSFKKGQKAWNEGLSGYLTHTEETKRKISNTLKTKGINQNEKHGMWKGDEAKYTALHSWIERHKPKPNECEKCHRNKKLELSNKDHNYKRDINDYRWLCHLCHMKYDAKMRKYKKRGIMK